jgi:hypothetical protein
MPKMIYKSQCMCAAWINVCKCHEWGDENGLMFVGDQIVFMQLTVTLLLYYSITPELSVESSSVKAMIAQSEAQVSRGVQTETRPQPTMPPHRERRPRFTMDSCSRRQHRRTTRNVRITYRPDYDALLDHPSSGYQNVDERYYSRRSLESSMAHMMPMELQDTVTMFSHNIWHL